MGSLSAGFFKTGDIWYAPPGYLLCQKALTDCSIALRTGFRVVARLWFEIHKHWNLQDKFCIDSEISIFYVYIGLS